MKTLVWLLQGGSAKSNESSLGRRRNIPPITNTQIGVGKRIRSLGEFCAGVGFHIANNQMGPDNWTFCSSTGVRRRVDFLLHSKDIAVLLHKPWVIGTLVWTIVRPSLQQQQFQTRTRKRKTINKGWTPANVEAYHALLRHKLAAIKPTNIQWIEQVDAGDQGRVASKKARKKNCPNLD